MSFKLVDQWYEAAVDIESVVLHEENPRDGDVGSIAESIGEVGFYGAPIIDAETRQVLAGNHRIMAARAVGGTAIPMIFVRVETTEGKKILLGDNRTSDLAGYKDHALAKLLQEIATESPNGLIGTGYNGDDLDTLLARIEKDTRETFDGAEEDGEGSTSSKQDLLELYPTEVGDLWVVYDPNNGVDHTIGCLDSRDPQSYAYLIGQTKIDLTVTDPPYGIEYDAHVVAERDKSATRAYSLRSTIEGDEVDEAAFEILIDQVVASVRQFSTDAAACYMFSGSDLSHVVKHALDACYGRRCKELVWVKERGNLSPEHYSRRHELIYYTWTKGARWFGEAGETTVLEHHKPSSFGYELDDGSKNTGNTSLIHPTQKPVDLLIRLIENSSAPGDSVLDPFLGSGSTAVAAVKTRRRFYGMDIDPLWVAATLDRLTRLGCQVQKVIARLGGTSVEAP